MVPNIQTSIAWVSVCPDPRHLDLEFTILHFRIVRVFKHDVLPGNAKSREELTDHLQDNILGGAI